jgi:putative ABC transport system permease protein
MLKNYWKIAIRNLVRNKLHSVINITGLALGMAAATILLLNIQYGLSIDQFHEKKAHLFEAYNKGIINGQLICWNTTASPLGPVLKSIPEIKNVARIRGGDNLFQYADKKIQTTGFFTDPAFLTMFSFPLVTGDATSALKDPNDVVITQQLATRLFGDQDPMNKTITTPAGDNFIVTGVLKDLPTNTQFKFEYLLPLSWLRNPGGWLQQNTFTWVELTPGANLDAVNKKIGNVIPRDNAAAQSQDKDPVFLYPLTKAYLENHFENGRPAGGNIDNLKMLGGLAAIILLIACINFMNLSTARSEKRGREVGIRKVIGALRSSLIGQFISESIFMALLAGLIALALVQLTIPYFNNLTHTELTLPGQSPLFWISAIGFVIFTGMLAGSYPAFYLSSFRPIKVLKGVFQNSNALVAPRKVLVVVQFVFSIFLINFTLIYQKQVHHELSREIGYATQDLVYHPLNRDLRKSYSAVKNELLTTGVASSVSESSTIVSQVDAEESGLKWAGMDPKANPAFVLMAENGGFIQTSGLSLIAGRDLDIERYPGDTLSCVINEASVKVLGFKNPIGSIIQDDDQRWKIVGVVKDFLAGSANENYKPVLIKGGVGDGYIDIRISHNRPFGDNVQLAENILKKYNPAYITDLRFVDKDYKAKFQQAQNVAMLINTFTFIAIFVSCMGLLGLAAYTTENRTREIGIRKVLGSSVAGIVSLLARDFVKLIAISIVIASPPAWLCMQSYLRMFAYRTSVNGWVLAASGAAALLLALVTIGFQVTRAALQNPVKNLRTDG